MFGRRKYTTSNAITDLATILSHYDERDTGAVPMPIRTVKEAYNALILKSYLFETIQRIDNEHANQIVDNLEKNRSKIRQDDLDAFNMACEVLRIIINDSIT